MHPGYFQVFHWKIEEVIVSCCFTQNSNNNYPLSLQCPLQTLPITFQISKSQPPLKLPKIMILTSAVVLGRRFSRSFPFLKDNLQVSESKCLRVRHYAGLSGMLVKMIWSEWPLHRLLSMDEVEVLTIKPIPRHLSFSDLRDQYKLYPAPCCRSCLPHGSWLCWE